MGSPAPPRTDPLEQSLALADASGARLAAVEEVGVSEVTRVYSEALASWTAADASSSGSSGDEGSPLLTAAVLAALVAALRSTVLASEAEGRVFVRQQAELLGATPADPERSNIGDTVQQAVVESLRGQVSLGSGQLTSKRDAEERAAQLQQRAEIAVRALTWMAYHDAVYVGLVRLSAELEQVGVRTRRMWVARFDKATPPCSLCVRLHGTHVGMGEEFPVPDTEPAPYGGALTGPPRHPRCRCRVVPYLPDVEPAERGPTPARMVAFAQRVLELNNTDFLVAATIIRVKPYTRVVEGRTQQVGGYYYDIQTGRKVDPSQVNAQDIKEVSRDQAKKLEDKSRGRAGAQPEKESNRFPPGTYEVSMPDGSVTKTVVNKDGSSTSTHNDQSEDADSSQTTSFLSYWDGQGAVRRTGEAPEEPKSADGKEKPKGKPEKTEDKPDKAKAAEEGGKPKSLSTKQVASLLSDAGMDEETAKKLSAAIDQTDSHQEAVSQVMQRLLDRPSPDSDADTALRGGAVRVGDRDLDADHVRRALEILRAEQSTSVSGPLRREGSPLARMPLREWANQAEGRTLHYGHLKPAVIRMLENALGEGSGRTPDRPPAPSRPPTARPQPLRPQPAQRDVLDPPSRQASQFSGWGDRAAEIVASPGPSLRSLTNVLRDDRAQGRARMSRALERLYNGENGLGRNGARVKMHDNLYVSSERAFAFGGAIMARDGRTIGSFSRTFRRDENGKFVELHNGYLSINDSDQGQGIATDLYRRQENWAIAEGVEKVTIDANIDIGGYAWARAGFDYASTQAAITHIQRLRDRALRKYGGEGESYKFFQQRLRDYTSDRETNPLPTPYEISRLGYREGMRTWPGKELMLGTDWSAVKKLVPTPPPSPAPQRDIFAAPQRNAGQFSGWGDRAQEISASPGPSLRSLHAALSASPNDVKLHNRAMRAIEGVYNQGGGLGSANARVSVYELSPTHNGFTLRGNILDRDGKNVGRIRRTFVSQLSTATGRNEFFELHNDLLSIVSSAQGQGIATDLYRRQENWAIAEGVEKITIHANIDVGGYAWARAGFDFAERDGAVRFLWQMIQKAGNQLPSSNPSRRWLEEKFSEFTRAPDTFVLPTPFELSRLGWAEGLRTWDGKQLMLGMNWQAVKRLVPTADRPTPTPQPARPPAPPPAPTPPTPPAPQPATPGRVRVGQALVSRAQVQEAIDLLMAERSTSVTGPLRNTNNPLARLNLRQLANERAGTTLHYGRLKPAVIEMLRDILRQEDRPPTPPPEPVRPPPTPPAPQPTVVRPPTPPTPPAPVTGGGLLVGGVRVTPAQIRDAIRILRNESSTSIRSPLERAGHPLAGANLRALADEHRGERVHYGRLKPAVIEMLEAKLAEAERGRGPEPAPPAPTPPSPPPAPAPILPAPSRPGVVPGRITESQLNILNRIDRQGGSISDRAGQPGLNLNIVRALERRGFLARSPMDDTALQITDSGREVLRAQRAVSPPRPPSRVQEDTRAAISSAIAALPSSAAEWRRARSRDGRLSYPTDVNGQLMPPEEYQRHLDSVLEAGRLFDRDLNEALSTNLDYIATQNRLVQSTGLAAWRAEREQLKVRLRVMYEMLAESRSFGNEQQTAVSGESPLIADVEAMEKLFPDDWIHAVNVRGNSLRVNSAQRGSFIASRSGWGSADVINVSGAASPTDYYRAVGSQRREVMLHELGHRMEVTIPGLTELQFTLIRRRATHDGRLESAVPISSHTPNEFSLADRWRSRYTARTYESRHRRDPAGENWEAFQTGLQHAVAGNHTYADQDLSRLVFGALLTLGHGSSNRMNARSSGSGTQAEAPSVAVPAISAAEARPWRDRMKAAQGALRAQPAAGDLGSALVSAWQKVASTRHRYYVNVSSRDSAVSMRALPFDPDGGSYIVHSNGSVWERTLDADGNEQLRLLSTDEISELTDPHLSSGELTVPQALSTVRSLTDSQLDDIMQQTLLSDNVDAFDKFAAEADRRDARARQSAARNETRARELETLLNQGKGEEDAIEDVYGVSADRQRRRAAIASLRSAGYTGVNLTELSRAAFRDAIYQRYLEAETSMRGHMLSREGESKGISPLSLFTGPSATAEKYASPELLEWWEFNGRPTYDEWLRTYVEQFRAA